jgi:hypothetical protein
MLTIFKRATPFLPSRGSGNYFKLKIISGKPMPSRAADRADMIACDHRHGAAGGNLPWSGARSGRHR